MLLALSASCWALLCPGDAPAGAPAPEPRYALGGVLLSDYSTDFGLGLGVNATVERFDAGRAPWQAALTAQVYASTGGQQVHYLALDVPQAFGGAWRLGAVAGYRRDQAAPWYGAGNDARIDPSKPAGYYRWDEEAPYARVSARRALFASLSAFAQYRLSYNGVRAAPGSLLAAEAPTGLGGGRFAEGAVGLVWDSRDFEPSPTTGLLVEASARTAQRWLGAESSFTGLFASATGYARPLERVVVAARVAFDRELGDVPFNHLRDLGAYFALSGLGGGSTIRGLVPNELVGHQKLLANLEARVRLLTLRWDGHEVSGGLAAFVDTGRVWDGADASAPWTGLRAGYGGGVRAWCGRYFVWRGDVGFAEGRARVYFEVGQMF